MTSLANNDGCYLSKSQENPPGRSKPDIFDYLDKALNVRQAQAGTPFYHLALPDGRGYLLPATTSSAAVNGLSMYTPQRFKGKVAKTLFFAALRTGFAKKISPVINLDISRFQQIVASIFCRNDLMLAISLGVNGPYGKPVIKVMRGRRETLGYIKVGWNETSAELVANEFSTLTSLHKLALQYASFPKVVDCREWCGRLLLASGCLPVAGGSKPHFCKEYFQCLLEIAQKEGRQEALCHGGLWKELTERVHVLAGFLPHEQILVLEKALCLVRKQFGQKSLPFFWRLGDFSPWHVKVNAAGKVHVIDLENARPFWLPGYDVFRFFHQAQPGQEHQIIQSVKQSQWAMAYFRWLNLEQLLYLLHFVYWIDLWSEYAVSWKKYGQLSQAARLWFAEQIQYIDRLAADIGTGGRS